MPATAIGITIMCLAALPLLIAAHSGDPIPPSFDRCPDLVPKWMKASSHLSFSHERAAPRARRDSAERFSRLDALCLQTWPGFSFPRICFAVP